MTDTFQHPDFKNVMILSGKSNLKGDKEAKAELERLDSLVDPYFEHKKLIEWADWEFKTEEETSRERNKHDSLPKKMIRTWVYMQQ